MRAPVPSVLATRGTGVQVAGLIPEHRRADTAGKARNRPHHRAGVADYTSVPLADPGRAAGKEAA
jgi:hypothetical protein